MEKISYEELEEHLKQVNEENKRLIKEVSTLQAKLYEMQFMIKKYIMQD